MTSTKVQSGRTIIETLGVLAIIGIITVVSVKLFNSAMTQHRANELMNEANERAVSVAAQIVAGKDKNALSIAEFPNTNGYTFGVEANPTNPARFNLTVDAVDVDACKRLKTMIGPYTALRAVSTDCTILTFNDDLSREAVASDYDTNSAACTEAGYKICAWGDGGIARKCYEDTSINCCAGVSYDHQCQSCAPSTGGVSKQPNTKDCYVNNDPDRPSKCNNGVCVDPDVTNGSVCTSNADCGGVGSGYYCKIVYAASNLNGTLDNINTDCYKDLTGTCTPMPYPTQLTSEQRAFLEGASFPSTFVYGPGLNWWSAKNWCEAQGKQLMDVSEFDCYRKTDNELVAGGQLLAWCCKEGQACQQSGWNTNLWNGKSVLPGKAEEVAKFSDKIIALRKAFGATNFWTISPYGVVSDNSCRAFAIRSDAGYADYYNRSSSPKAFCK